MFTLKVSDLETARREHYAWADHIISLLDPDTAAGWPRHHDRHLVVGMDDVELLEPGALLPAEQHVETILAFGRAFQAEQRVIVHCHAGISRSTATAIALLVSHQVPVARAFEQVRSQRGSRFWPNRRLIELYDRHLGLGGTLVDHVADWKTAQRAELERRNDPEAAVFLARLNHHPTHMAAPHRLLRP